MHMIVYCLFECHVCVCVYIYIYIHVLVYRDIYIYIYIVYVCVYDCYYLSNTTCLTHAFFKRGE